MSPTAVIHIILTVIVLEYKLVNRLRSVHDLANQRLSERILERTFRTIGYSHTYTSHFTLMIYVVCSKIEIIFPICFYHGRCP